MRRAFTLLETLLTVTLTVSVGIAALSLTTLQARLATTAHAQEESLALVTETMRLLDDDLLLAVRHAGYGRFLVQDGGALRLTTGNRLPSEPAGPCEVLWRFDAAAGTVLRTSTPPGGGEATTRAIGHGWRLFAVALDPEGLWLQAQTAGDAQPWRLLLWTDAK